MKDQWEYLDVTCVRLIEPQGWGTDNLNHYGEEGWELVSVTPVDGYFHHIFKRRIDNSK